MPEPLLQVDVVTLFPELFDAPLSTSIIGRAVERGIVLRVQDERPAHHDGHRRAESSRG